MQFESPISPTKRVMNALAEMGSQSPKIIDTATPPSQTFDLGSQTPCAITAATPSSSASQQQTENNTDAPWSDIDNEISTKLAMEHEAVADDNLSFDLSVGILEETLLPHHYSVEKEKKSQPTSPIRLDNYLSQTQSETLHELHIVNNKQQQHNQQQLQQQQLTNIEQPVSETDNNNNSMIMNAKDVSSLFEMIGDLTEKIKGITSKTDLIPNIQSEVNSMQAQMKSLKQDLGSQVADLSGRVLVNEGDITYLRTELQSNKQYVTDHVKPVISQLVKGGLTAKITANESAIADLKTRWEETSLATNSLDKTMGYGLSEEDTESIARYLHTLTEDDAAPTKRLISKAEKDIEQLKTADNKATEKLRQLEEKIHQLQNQKKTTNSTNLKNDNQSRKKSLDVTKHTLDTEVVIIGDSNTTRIDMPSIGKGTTRRRFTCFTIPQAKKFIETATIDKKPAKVLLHVGTNDVVNSDIEELKKGFDDLIDTARRRFPESRVLLSSIFVRKDKKDKLNKTIVSLNNYLDDFCDRTPKMSFMDNNNVEHHHMEDPKHVNPTGLHKFICNIRHAVFGETLSSSRQRAGR